MKLRHDGKTAFDDPIVCRCCGHHFTSSTALAQMSGALLEEMKRALHVGQLEQMTLACPKCFSTDIMPEILAA